MKEMYTVEYFDVKFDVYFSVEHCKDGEKVFDIISIELQTSADNLLEFLDSRVVENLEKLAIRKYFANEKEGDY